MARNLRVETVTIPNASSTGDAIAMANNRVPLAVITPAAMTNSALTFESSDDFGVTFRPVFYEGTQYSVTISTTVSRHVALDRRAFEGVQLVRLRTATNEGALRTLKIISGE